MHAVVHEPSTPFDEDACYPHALSGPQQVYGRRVEVFCTGAGRTQSRLPGRHTELLAAIRTPEGPLHFAGDHTSVKPSWIEGALVSGVRAALEMHQA
jgi:monoamine oxidase